MFFYLQQKVKAQSHLLARYNKCDNLTDWGSDLAFYAMNMAVWSRKPPKGLILHADRGSQYCSHEYQKLLILHYIICSMSKRGGGDCYDNAAMESWNHSFKVEAIHGEKFATRVIAKNHVFE